MKMQWCEDCEHKILNKRVVKEQEIQGYFMWIVWKDMLIKKKPKEAPSNDAWRCSDVKIVNTKSWRREE